MSLPMHEAYRPSGHQWLGSFPASWSMRPLWTLFRRVKRTDHADEQLLSVYRDHGVVPKASRDDNFNKASDDLSTYQLVEPGDLAINKMKAWQGSVAISEFRGIVSPAYFVLKAVHREAPRYLHYLLRSSEYTAGYLSISKGIRPNQWDLEPQEHSRMPVLLPPLSEQTAIAAFLDRETAKIDALVEQQKRLIELLKEKRQAIISNAVTKGLNPDAKMKNSGIEWLGEVPEHWDVTPVGSRYSVQLGKMLDTEKIVGNDLRPYLRVFDVQWGRINVDDLPEMDFDEQSQKRYALKPGDLMVNEGGSYVGRCAIWHALIDECYYQKALHRLRPFRSETDTTRYMYYVLTFATMFGVFIAGGNQNTIDHLPAEKLRRYRFAFPSGEEQEEIAQYLDGQTAKLDTLVSEAEAGIALLQERRSALISAAVTGIIDVRQSTAPQADRSTARLIISAEIIEQLWHRPTFGRVKLQKIIYLAETCANLNELGGNYLREAAGPLDRALMDDMENLLQRDNHVAVRQPDGPGGQVQYVLTGSKGVFRGQLDSILGQRKARFEHLIATVGNLDTKGAEAVATLFAVWNDALIAKQSITDDQIVHGVLTEWHPEKSKKFKPGDLHTWLGWMRRNEIIPTGTGPQTSTGRLLV